LAILYVACNTGLVANATQYLLPLQFGVGVNGGAEGIVHSVWIFLKTIFIFQAYGIPFFSLLAVTLYFPKGMP